MGTTSRVQEVEPGSWFNGKEGARSSCFDDITFIISSVFMWNQMDADKLGTSYVRKKNFTNLSYLAQDVA